MTRNYLLIIILTIAAFLRFWQLGTNPPELYADEVSNGYNAYSILKTGRDEYGNFLPATFRAFGDYNLPLSVYLLVPSIAIFDLSAFAVRFPSALFGTLTVLLTYLLTKKLFGDPKYQFSIAHVSALLLAISPWHLQFSRYDHEANFMVFFVVLGVTLFLYSTNNFRLLILSAIAFSLGLNTYHGAKVWVPLILSAIVVCNFRQLMRFKLKLALPLAILAISTVPTITNLDQASIRAQSVGIFAKGENPGKLFISGYLSHFSPNFLFMAGDTIGRHSVPGMGQLYVFELPLILAGILFLIQGKTAHKKLLFSWLLLAPIPAALATPTPHALRSLTFLPLWSIIASLGLFSLLKSNIRFKTVILAGLFLIAAYNMVTYFHLYYKHYPKLKGPDWNDGHKEMVGFVDKIKNDYETIAITNYYGHPYIFVLFYSQYDPKLYQLQSQDKNKFDKFEFFGESWEKKTQGKVLLVRPAWQIPNPAPHYIKFIHGKNGDLIFRISEE